MDKNFCHLHFHSEYSLLDGACRIKDIPEAVKKAGQSCIALTDHGVMYGAVDFYKACKNNGIKPIIGCEIYVSPRSRFDKDKALDANYYHLVLLCKNDIGYKNLIHIVSRAFTEGFYSKPRADLELLKAHSEGIIALSACLGGAIPQQLINGDYDGAREYAKMMCSIFSDGFYLELQRHGIPEQTLVNDGLIRISNETDIPLVATNDVHYLNKSDAQKQAVLMCIQTNTTLSEGRHKGFEKDEFYLKSTEEMAQLFFDVPEALENTVKIANECNFDFCFDKLFLPAFYPPCGLSSKDYLQKLCNDGLKTRISQAEKHGKALDEKAYKERLDYELSVVTQMGYDEYYLIVNDFISYAKSQKIPVGPGRGSGAGSLAAYCLGITDIDPIEYDLLFERFLNPERVSMPDFDVDFCYYRRSEVIDYVAQKYGRDHVAQIVTFGTLAAKAAVRDVGRVMGIAYSEVDRVAKCIPFALNMTIDKALNESPELKEIYENESALKSVIDIARAIEGMPRNASTHAAGVVITDKPVSDYVPLSMNGDLIVTQYTMNNIADLGLLKIDFLGLRYLTVIYKAASSAGINVHDIPLDDAQTYELLSSGKTGGIFQLESPGMRNLLTKMKPASIEDITIAISLYRPGPMDSIPKFLENRRNPEKITYADKRLEDILSVTNGCIVYQEQVMQIFRSLAGYSFGRADIVRRAMAKKKKEVMEQEREYFIYGKKNPDGQIECVGAVANGVPEDIAKQIYDEMSTFAQYAFNKSHAAAYAHLAYYSAYLKRHFPGYYMSELLTSVLERSDKVMEYINDCKNIGISVLNPDINQSVGDFCSPSENQIRFGLMALKNVGESFVRQIIKKREQGKFRSFEDFLTRMSDCDINKRMIESLIRAGAFDSFGKRRSQLMSVYESAVDTLQRRTQKNIDGQYDMFSAPSAEDSHSTSLVIEYPDILEFSQFELLTMEKDVAGIYMSGHPLEKYRRFAQSIKADSISDINDAAESESFSKYFDGAKVTLVGTVAKKKEKITKSDKRMAFIDFEDMSGAIEIIAFPNVYNEFVSSLYEGAMIGVSGEISLKEARGAEQEKNEMSVILKNVFALKELPDKIESETAYAAQKNNVSASTNTNTVKLNLSQFRKSVSEASVSKHQKHQPQDNGYTAYKSNNTQEEHSKPSENQRLCLYLKVPSENSREFERVKSILEIYNYGNSPVYVYFDDTKKLTHAVGIDVEITKTMLLTLSTVISEDCVKTKYKEI